MKIVLYEHPTLRTKSENVEKIDDELKKTLDEMVETMRKANGVGLAANQVNIPKRFFVLEVENIVKKIINPEILEKSVETVEYEEGCLSIPGVYKKVSRPSEIKVKYLNENSEEVIENLSEMWARAFQHELDHLDGVLFIDRISVLNKRLILKKLELMKKEFAKGKKYRED
ncbi:peptide deformylase [Leptotrichia sp. OH3620_COT-345]|uniref:peptide deformylase n=1 Tax=Leptotrichia sp. OH3620_COT-345 TaxID=2491048 RepID=UPI000F653F3F|nr:peptide deformylase [Leptotrichia sp. OH3620_COT-345]RRD39938.1 peptide deformylase [Leptotrichia sp. OH3620_COT-345]